MENPGNGVLGGTDIRASGGGAVLEVDEDDIDYNDVSFDELMGRAVGRNS